MMSDELSTALLYVQNILTYTKHFAELTRNMSVEDATFALDEYILTTEKSLARAKQLRSLSPLP